MGSVTIFRGWADTTHFQNELKEILVIPSFHFNLDQDLGYMFIFIDRNMVQKKQKKYCDKKEAHKAVYMEVSLLFIDGQTPSQIKYR